MLTAWSSLLLIDGSGLVVASFLASTIIPGRQDFFLNLRDKSGKFHVLLHVSKLFAASMHAHDIWSSDDTIIYAQVFFQNNIEQSFKFYHTTWYHISFPSKTTKISNVFQCLCHASTPKVPSYLSQISTCRDTLNFQIFHFQKLKWLIMQVN